MRELRRISHRAVKRLREVVRQDILILSLLAMIVGAAVGGAVILFRETIAALQAMAYGTGSPRLSIYAAVLPWWHVLLAPTVGGLLVGLWVHLFLPGRRPQGVADAIEASTLNAGRMSPKAGLWGAVVNAMSIGVGASVGREGPAVHLGAAIGSWFAQRLKLARRLSRTLLGCGVASAVAASFNAPIAGALFANEVVIGHYALNSFAPVVISSVIGTMVSRAYFGDFPAFEVSAHPVFSAWELPAFLGLGVLAGITAILFVRGIKVTQDIAAKTPGPPWLRPALGGVLVGLIAIPLPQVLGVGYGVTEQVIVAAMPLGLAATVCVAKLVATAISFGFGFGGGVFSPSLVIGATLGGTYGMVLADVLPAVTSGSSAYTIIGMGAMAAAVLGAPISTTLIVFEMTADYKLTMAVMLAVVVSTVIGRSLHGQSFFTWQLEQRGLDLHGGFQAALLRNILVREVVSLRCEVVTPGVGLHDLRGMLQHSMSGELFVINDQGRLIGTLTLADMSETAFDRFLDDLVNAGDIAHREAPVLALDDSLETALKVMRTTGQALIAVVDDHKTRRFDGALHERDAMTAYTRALLEARREEHP